jgi:hypothetical protein
MVGTIVQLSDSFMDLSRSLFSDIGVAVDGARYGHRADTRRLGYVL